MVPLLAVIACWARLRSGLNPGTHDPGPRGRLSIGKSCFQVLVWGFSLGSAASASRSLNRTTQAVPRRRQGSRASRLRVYLRITVLVMAHIYLTACGRCRRSCRERKLLCASNRRKHGHPCHRRKHSFIKLLLAQVDQYLPLEAIIRRSMPAIFRFSRVQDPSSLLIKEN